MITKEDKTDFLKELNAELNAKGTMKRVINSFDEGIHPAGCVKKFKDDEGKDHLLIVEPLEPNTYVYVIDGVKGVAQTSANSKTGKTFLNIEGRDFLISGSNGKGLEEGMFQIINHPSVEEVHKWVKGKRKALTADEIFNRMNVYFKTYLDLGEDCYYSLLTMTVFLSWLQELLKSVWYVVVTGEFGGGKTTTAEALTLLCKHGSTPGDCSVSYLSRGIDMLKMVPFLDEFDSIAGEEDSEHYAIIRMGQKRGQPFSRMGDKGATFQYFDIFGTKIMVVHGQLEDALQSRSLVINVCESEDWKVATVGRSMRVASTKLYTELFIWALSTPTIYDIVDDVDDVDDILYNNSSSIDEIRGKLVSVFLAGKLPQQPNIPQQELQKCKFKGRDAEINDIWMSILRVLGLKTASTENLNNDISKLIILKAEIRDEMRETGIVGMLRDFLIKKYKFFRNNSSYFSSDGYFMISHRYVSEEFKKDNRNSGEFITKGSFTGALKELGFVGGANGNKKPMRVYDEDDGKEHVRAALIFDDRVQRKLGIKINNHNQTGGMMDQMEDINNNI